MSVTDIRIFGTLPLAGRTNRTVRDATGTEHVHILHNGRSYTIKVAHTEQDLAAVAELDREVFATHRGTNLEELHEVYRGGKILMLLSETGELIGESQIIISATSVHASLSPDEALCFGTALRAGNYGQGYAQVLFKGQEVIALEANKRTMSLTARVENARSIRSRMRMGYRVTGYNASHFGPFDAGGARLIMTKSLFDEPIPFDPALQASRLRAGDAPILTTSTYESTLAAHPTEVAVPIRAGNLIDGGAHMLVERALASDFIGTGLLRPEECTWLGSDRSILVFQRAGSLPVLDHVHSPVDVHSEYGRLEEVVASYSPFVASITSSTAINTVARHNIGNVDPIAFHDEHEAFVDTLRSEGIYVVRSSLWGSESSGSAAVFARDPAIVLDDTLITCTLFRAERQSEPGEMRRLCRSLAGSHLVDQFTGRAILEGGDVVILDDEQVLIGLGERTTEAGIKQLSSLFPHRRFIGVRHPDLHLDVLFAVLGKKTALADLTRLPPDFIEYLLSSGFTVIEADPHEQPTLCCNVLAIDDRRVVAAAENKVTNQRLRDAGICVIEVSMPNILKKGGGPRCLTCPTRRR